MEPMRRSHQKLITRSKDIMSGTPFFRGTRVSVQTMVDYLEAGDPLVEFLDDFPTVTREQAPAVLELAKELIRAWRMRILLDESVPRPLKAKYLKLSR